MSRLFHICMDTGGTFTDGILIDEEGSVSMAKASTTPEDPQIGIMNCLRLLAQTQPSMSFAEFMGSVGTYTLGTTVATNALIQLSGAKACMLTTKGFRDILEWRRLMIKRNIYDLRLPKPVILIPRHLRYVAEERIDARGEIITPLNEGDVREAAVKIRAKNVQAVAVCFLHSYINPQHERRAGEILREELPGVEIVLSSDVLPRPLEFERFSTTALAAYLGPKAVPFLRNLDKNLTQNGFRGSFLVLTGNGAVANVETVAEQPISILSSGPSAGPVLSTFLGKNAGFQDIISVDMGGTSFDVSVVPRGEIPTTTDSVVCDQRNASDVVDVSSIGAGGGSIAHLDERGMLCVGPQSAGANPGPACYCRGGQEPTVTDADVVLGYIPSDYFLGGSMKVDPALAERVIQEKIATPLGTDVVEAAYGIWSLLITKASHEIFIAATTRGYDPRHFTLCVGGGAGPVHIFGLAQQLGIKELYIPKMASAYCAYGMSFVDFKHEFMRYIRFLSKDVNLDRLTEIYQELETKGVSLLKKEGVREETAEIGRGAQVQYLGQFHSIEAWLSPTPPGRQIDKQDFEALIEDYHDRHRRQRGYSDSSAPTEVKGLTLKTIGRRKTPNILEQPYSGEDTSHALRRSRTVYFRGLGGFVETRCYDGDQLRNGNIVVGPAVIEERATTVVIPPKAMVSVDRYGNYLGKLL